MGRPGCRSCWVTLCPGRQVLDNEKPLVALAFDEGHYHGGLVSLACYQGFCSRRRSTWCTRGVPSLYPVTPIDLSD